MKSVQRILPYTNPLVQYALYDILDSENSVYNKEDNKRIVAKVTVYGNRSEFVLSVTEEKPIAVLMVQITKPCEGLSEQGSFAR